MADFRPGDRVKVGALAGRVTWVAAAGESIDVLFDGRDVDTEDLPVELVEHVENFTRPPRGGDAATLAVLRALPEGSIVTAPDGTIAQRHNYHKGYLSGWVLPGDDRLFAAESIAPQSLTVLRVGWTSPAQTVTTERAT